MKERPILFSAAMVRAILSGAKTQTRRIVKHSDPYEPMGENVQGEPWPMVMDEYGDYYEKICPYGVHGDRLWVRETFVIGYPIDGTGKHYSALAWTGADEQRDGKVFYAADRFERPDEPRMPWRPSIYMPRWASRITLEVIGVRVERLQAITEDDARAEGVDGTGPVGYIPAKTSMGYCRYDFASLWDGINADRAPWASNPWVWVVSFRRVLP